MNTLSPPLPSPLSPPPSSPSPDLSIVIVSWNTRDLLAQCLESVAENVGTWERGNVETFVVDNASSDGSAAMVRERFPWVHLIENRENVGFARANNQAIRQSSDKYVLLLNSDAMLTPGAAQAMVAFMESHPSAGICSVRITFPDGRPQFCYGNFPSLWNEFKSLFGMHRWDLSVWDRLNEPMRVDWVSGACLMARHDVLDEIGCLDETIFMFGEEVDLCFRAHQANWETYIVPAPPVIHVRAGSTGSYSSKRTLALYNGKSYYARKHLGRSQEIIIHAMILLSAILKLIGYSLLAIMRSNFKVRQRLWVEVVRSLLCRKEIR